MKSLWLSFAAISALVAGCATAPPLRKPQVQPPQAYEAPRPPADSLAGTALDRWWTLYGDAQLNGLVDLALANSPDAKDAISKLDQANAIRTETPDQPYIPPPTPS